MKSILWEDGSSEQDKRLVYELVNETVSGNQKHKEKCVEKILKKISTKAWQSKYIHKYFIFCMYYAQQIRLLDIKTILTTEALELIYYTHSKNNSKVSFADKLKYVFKKYYKKEMYQESAEILRIIRNNTAHTGSIKGIISSLKRREIKTIKSFKDRFQIATIEKALYNLAFEFHYLMKDVLIRSLGLEWEDLSQNCRPAFLSEYFITPKPSNAPGRFAQP